MEGSPGLNEEPPSVSATGQNAVEDAALTITGLSVGFAEDAFTLTVSVADGTLFIPTDNGLGVSGEGTDSLTITGVSPGSDLAGLVYTPDLNFNGDDTLTVEAIAQAGTNTATATIAVSAVNDAPVLTSAGSTVDMHVGGSVTLGVNVSDVGLDSLNNGTGDYAGATFTVGPHGGGSSNDGWSVGSDVTISGSNLEIAGKTVATYGFNGSDDLVFSFTANATTALVDDLLQNVGYGNNDATAGSSVTLDYTFNDGAPHFGPNAGHSSAAGSVLVDVVGPVIANAGPTASVHGQTLLDPELRVSDGALDALNNGAGDYAGATFAIARVGGDNGNDFFNVDTSTGITLIKDSGDTYDAQFGGKTFATWTDDGSVLTIAFTGSETAATTALVNGLLQHVLYYNSAPGSSVTLDYTFNDGSNLGNPATASVQVGVTGPIFAHETASVYAPPVDGAVLEPNLTVSDPSLDALNGGAGDYDGATFSIARDGGSNPDDGYFIDPSSGIGVTGPDNQLQIGGQTVADASVNNGSLTISFTSDATTAAVDNVMEHVGYVNDSDTPPDSVKLDYTFNDGLETATSSVQAFVGIACYCAGTLILTDHGEVPVETLQIGDRVVTMSCAGRPIKWIGQRSYGGRFIMGRKDILPICFKTGSLGGGMPKRDLWISPHHAMFLDDVLIEAKDLVNGVSIVQAAQVDEVEYFHIELDTHDVIVAEGALSETFVDDDSRAMFHNAHQYAELYPNEGRRLAPYCAPRIEYGYELDKIRRRIAERGGLITPPTHVGNLRGHVDRVGHGMIDGWAQDESYPEAPVCLDIVVDGKIIGQALANRYREDLESAGLGSGRHGFRFQLPEGMLISPGMLGVCRALDGRAVGFSCAEAA